MKLLLPALLLTACVSPSDVYVAATHDAPQLDVYVVTATSPTEQGQRIVEAIAHCDDGDAVLAGGCTWGVSANADDLPLYPMADTPDGLDGWLCRGRNGGVGTHLEPVMATAICSARGES